MEDEKSRVVDIADAAAPEEPQQVADTPIQEAPAPAAKPPPEDKRLCTATLFVPGMYDRPGMAIHKEWPNVRMSSITPILNGAAFATRDGREVIVLGMPVTFEQE